jgi:hypothetical protein
MSPPFPPEPPGLELLHDRTYGVRSYRLSPTEFLLRGTVHDFKPARVFIEDAKGAMDMHQMVVDLTITFPNLVITKAEVVFETYPALQCPGIATAYEGLVGVSIARGFSRQLRELFGGPRGCQHVTALIQAMSPVAVQTMMAMLATPVRRDANGRTASADSSIERKTKMDPDDAAKAIERASSINRNTCHVWAEDGPMVDRIRRGEPVPTPVTIARRLEAEGLSPDAWSTRHRM